MIKINLNPGQLLRKTPEDKQLNDSPFYPTSGFTSGG